MNLNNEALSLKKKEKVSRTEASCDETPAAAVQLKDPRHQTLCLQACVRPAVEQQPHPPEDMRRNDV
ncbi:hypothetical protein EYF80_068363 [Liparis tanakae]|uniref:Uncharacterized protein n=1 Tax=Liparis tanakae TaxID=230148 RepID=A0A4Z2DYF4_9TELE|nr:hypothetical protein EYF80_068363 [Liparis tanakae]